MAMSIEQKRAILDSANGQIFSATFVKKDGTIREMVAKKWTEKAFTYGSVNARPNTQADKPEAYCAVDMDIYKNDPKHSFRTISLDKLVRAKVNGVEYKFD